MEDNGKDAKRSVHPGLVEVLSRQLRVIPHFFVREFLNNVEEDGSTMDRNCKLEEVGYKVSTHTDDDWKVTTPREEVIAFKRDT